MWKKCISNFSLQFYAKNSISVFNAYMLIEKSFLIFADVRTHQNVTINLRGQVPIAYE